MCSGEYVGSHRNDHSYINEMDWRYWFWRNLNLGGQCSRYQLWWNGRKCRFAHF